MTDKITQIRVGQKLIGLTGLEEIFQALKDYPGPPEELQEELLRRVAAKNYLPARLRPNYRSALWREFRRFRGDAVDADEPVGLEIKLLGLGCFGCQQFYQQVVNILANRRLQAGLDYITDPARLKDYDIRTFPALLINGRVAVAGRIPEPAELERILVEAARQGGEGTRGGGEAGKGTKRTKGRD
jgi:hypothetical protein